ncbi:hypothetical protein UVI_02003190 [Ustilaginoidea virens]|uniref:Uncharacterized protein n=1 Tax=Ustilaginoidea virens TaxID=1159556 RepID=A0A1B5L0V6_USTVR|nr:hypothetical protein UVI_02003190 [Ustilaginoidea virens]
MVGRDPKNPAWMRLGLGMGLGLVVQAQQAVSMREKVPGWARGRLGHNARSLAAEGRQTATRPQPTRMLVPLSNVLSVTNG